MEFFAQPGQDGNVAAVTRIFQVVVQSPKINMENENKKILALKYRPQKFSELLGQDVMVQTISNSIKLNKIPNAYLLTGIRGVGKTTTARIIAKALNCNKHFDHGSKKDSDTFCNCDEILNSRHLDVLEMDAASKTGIDDVRELIESSKYNPTSAKYKVIILDEVHMLSKQAFNGLLKTLEEPPPHLKFIFATTEVKKIPVTIISRCQRFDLHRVPIDTLTENLKKISRMENGKISEAALKLIAKAAEGSVRDSLSLLDRALVSENIQGKEVDQDSIKKMLGIADRSRILELLNFVFLGDKEKSIHHLRLMIDDGLEPNNFLNDLLEIIYFILQKKNLGTFESDLSISEAELETINSISNKIETTTLIVFWQFILKGLEEMAIVSNQILSIEMLIIRLIHLKGMPSYESLLNLADTDSSDVKKNLIKEDVKKEESNEDNSINKIYKDQIKNISQTKLELDALSNKDLTEAKEKNISSFQDLIKLSSVNKDIELKYDLEKNVNLIKFSQGKIDIGFNENLSKNFVRNLSESLLQWTGKRWVITLTKEKGQKSFSEMEEIKEKELVEKEKESETYKEIKSFFPDVELIKVTKD